MSFEPVGLGKQIQESRYALDGETWDESCLRVSTWVASAEADNRKEVLDAFNDVLLSGRFSPGGRIWYGAGRKNAQALNCFVLPVSDSREGWGQLFYDTTVVSGTGGGIGVNFGSIRGSGYPIRGTGGTASGAVSVMRMQSALGKGVVQGGSRRTALMQSLPINHPDIAEFVNVKKNRQELENANLSVIIPKNLNTHKLVEMIRSGKHLPLEFEGQEDLFDRYVDAGELWHTIVQNAWEGGEPGVLNAYLANQSSHISYAHDLVTTNPCGEIWLPEYGCCCLGALVLPRFVSNGQVDWELLNKTIGTSVRFLDNVLTVNQYPLEAIRRMSMNERRIGLGVMGLHSMLLDLGIRYSESHDFLHELFRFIQHSAYYYSCMLAAEKGSFALYTQEFAEARSLNLNTRLRNKIREYGLRNCAMLTIAPTGTTSMVQGVTSGIEPMYSPTYIRRVKNRRGVKDTETLVISEDYSDHPDIAEGAFDITPDGHFAVQKIAQRYFDNAVSKTINLPKDQSIDGLSDTWLKYLPHLKGTTLYREGSREWEPLEHIPTEDSISVIAGWEGPIDNQGNFSVEACKDGSCSI